MPTAGQDTRTLEQALRETAQAKWQGRRCYATNMAQVEGALRTIGGAWGTTRVWEITPSKLRSATAAWYAQGLAPATINKRLNCLSAMGVSVEGCRVREPKVLKWWLKPEDEEDICGWLDGSDDELRFGWFIEWTTNTGLRIEESLRLTWAEVSLTRREVTVPGLKTATAQATLPLSYDVVSILESIQNMYGPLAPHELVFGLTYETAHALWQKCRVMKGWDKDPTATLKALRRSAARHLHITKGMPLDMVRQYLRHEDIETTMGYLRLTGGYGTEEMRKWL